MEKAFSNKNRRRFPRFFIDLPLDYREMNGSCLRGAIVVNASEGGFLIESPRDIPVGNGLRITVLYPKRFELANFKVTAKIVWKESYWKENLKREKCWEGYQYGLEFVEIWPEDRWEMSFLLSGRLKSEEISPALCSQYY
jgi:PilZ domain